MRCGFIFLKRDTSCWFCCCWKEHVFVKWHVFKNHFSRSKAFDDLPSCLPVALVAHKMDKIGKDGGLTNMWNKSNGSKLHHHHHDESMVLKWGEVPEKSFPWFMLPCTGTQNPCIFVFSAKLVHHPMSRCSWFVCFRVSFLFLFACFQLQLSHDNHQWVSSFLPEWSNFGHLPSEQCLHNFFILAQCMQCYLQPLAGEQKVQHLEKLIATLFGWNILLTIFLFRAQWCSHAASVSPLRQDTNIESTVLVCKLVQKLWC